MVDPCLDAIVNHDNALVLQDVVAPDDAEVFESGIYSVPTNSAGANCGQMSFTLLNQDLQAFDEDWFQIKLLEGEEEFKFELT